MRIFKSTKGLMGAAAVLAAVLFFPTSHPYAASQNQAQVTINGMVCSFCAQGITKKFKSEAAVESVRVSLENKKVELKFKPGKSLSDDKIREIITDAGYNVEKILHE